MARSIARAAFYSKRKPLIADNGEKWDGPSKFRLEDEMVILLVLAAAGLMPPSDEANALGFRLARTSGIVTIAPMMVQKDVDDLSKEDLSLSRYQRERLTQIGKDEGTKGINRLAAALGMA